MDGSDDAAVAAFRDRVALLGRAGLPVAWAGEPTMLALAEAVRLGADPERILEAAVGTGLDAAARVRGAWRPWFYPALVCAGAGIAAAALATALTPVFEAMYGEFRVAPAAGMGVIEAARAAAPGLIAAAAIAFVVAWRAATAWSRRTSVHDPLRTALGCEALAAAFEAGVPSDRLDGLARGLGVATAVDPFTVWARGDDPCGVARGDALRMAARVARATAARRDGDVRWIGRVVVALVLAGIAVLASALVLFLPAIDFFHAVASPSLER